MHISLAILCYCISDFLMVCFAVNTELQLKALQEKYFEGLKEEIKGVPASSSISKTDNQISAKSTEDREESDPDYEQIARDNDERHLKLMTKKKRGLYEAMKVN